MWYRHTANSLINANMPNTAGLTQGWHAFFANDSSSGEIGLFGNFAGGLGQNIYRTESGKRNKLERFGIFRRTGASFKNNPKFQGLQCEPRKPKADYHLT